MLDILGTDDYQKYFKNTNKCRFSEKDGEVIVELLGSEHWNFIYKTQKLGKIDIRIKSEWINDYIEIYAIKRI